MIQCASCKYKIQNNQLVCPNCGFVFPRYIGDKTNYEKMLIEIGEEYRRANNIAIWRESAKTITQIETGNKQKKEGIVKRFNSERGYGYITGNDGTEVFAHYKDIVLRGYPFLKAGEKVIYVEKKLNNGHICAKQIRPKLNECLYSEFQKEGIVKWFDSERGYGYITGNDGTKASADYKDIVLKGYPFLKAGEKVIYVETVVNNGHICAKQIRLKNNIPSWEEESKKVEKIIYDIGEVNLDSKRKIKEAREAYNALTTEQKNLINNEVLKKLEYAEKRYVQLEIEKSEVSNVWELICTIGKVSLNSGSQIKEARKAYNALTIQQKERIGEVLKTLEYAEKHYEELVKEEEERRAQQDPAIPIFTARPTASEYFWNLVFTIGEVNLNSGSQIKEAREAYNALTIRQKLKMGKVLKELKALEKRYDKLVKEEEERRAK